MTPDTLRRIGHAAYGHDWRFALAYELGVSVRVVERWAGDQMDMPPTLEAEVGELLAHRIEMTAKLATLYAARLVTLKAVAADLSSGSVNAGNLAQTP